jgi:nucleoside-diphosphate-sugar epimerase
MKLLLVGATGQIGHALAKRLVAAGHETTLLVRDAARAQVPGARVVEARAFDRDSFTRALEGQDAAIYGVGLPEQFTFDTGVFARVNRDLFATFLDALGASALRRLVYISTYEVFEAVDGRIRESHAVARTAGLTPYFAAMTEAYRLALAARERLGLALTTIHPAAVYGGRDTGDGITHYLETILNWRVWLMPAVVSGGFPVVHVDSLADGIERTLGHDGAFIFSDAMTSLKSMAVETRRLERCWVPPTIPTPLGYASATAMEAFARLTRIRPPLARVQLDFITNGCEPLADRAATVLRWQPWPLGNTCCITNVHTRS